MFVRRISGTEGLRYDDRTLEPTLLALGDLFSDGELRLLLSVLMDTTAGELRSRLEPLGVIGKAEDAVETLGRAEVLQLLLLARNDDILDRVDSLIHANEEAAAHIGVQQGEIRRLMTNRGMDYGTFGVYPEISENGLRFTSDSFPIGNMRLGRLADSLFDLTDSDELSELNWQLRHVDGADPQERLDELVRSAGADEVVRRLILSRHSNQLHAGETLGLDYADFPSDDAFIEATLWKLGFEERRVQDLRKDFWDHAGRLRRFCQTAGVGARVDSVEMTARAANFFKQLEGVLDDTLAYATWTLTTDHLSQDRPFTYEPSRERLGSFSVLNSFAMRQQPESESFDFGGKNTLYPLIQGFALLADLLEDALARPAEYVREESDYPNYATHTELKKFAFVHVLPFLDLLDRSQSRIIETLRFASRSLDEANVAAVRNEMLHYRATTPEISRLDQAVDAAERVITRLQVDGLARTLFRAVSVDGDEWQRRVYTLRSANGTEVLFARPSAFDWNRMPRLRGGAQYVVPAAVFARPNEALRFRPTFDTEYARYWSDYPRRRMSRGAIDAALQSSDVDSSQPDL
ncbi:hypothetical protein GCM10009623_29630 [Nocardioides aestuarii]|uniref:Uncharacterized protein n=1 Tax=Nocardioides aestuarii TaxID=252231 RepID=A0ABW4TNG5_9ACTN